MYMAIGNGKLNEMYLPTYENYDVRRSALMGMTIKCAEVKTKEQ